MNVNGPRPIFLLWKYMGIIDDITNKVHIVESDSLLVNWQYVVDQI